MDCYTWWVARYSRAPTEQKIDNQPFYDATENQKNRKNKSSPHVVQKNTLIQQTQVNRHIKTKRLKQQEGKRRHPTSSSTQRDKQKNIECQRYK